LFWNAANDYSKPFAAMPTMMANPKTYLYEPPTAVAENKPVTPGQDKPAQEKAAPTSTGGGSNRP
jgi:hypothetical protein